MSSPENNIAQIAPAKLKQMTVHQLQQLELVMVSPEWEADLSSESQDTVDKSNKILLRVETAKLKLENSELENIKDKLIENNAKLQQGIKLLKQEINRLNSVSKVLAAAGNLLDTVIKITDAISS